MRPLFLVVASMLCVACGKDAAEPEDARSGGAGVEGEAPSAIDPEHLAAKIDPDPCGLVPAAQVQSILGLDTEPTAEAGSATAPARDHCRYAWSEGGVSRHVDVAWATALQDQPEKIAKGMELARKDLEAESRRVFELQVPGARLSTWSENWLTVYANDRQVLWVIMDESGKTPREARNFAAAIAAAAVQ